MRQTTLRQRREELRLRIEAVAAHLGLCCRTVVRYENEYPRRRMRWPHIWNSWLALLRLSEDGDQLFTNDEEMAQA